MEKYSKYKDSEIKWLGYVPLNWNIKRAKDISNITRGAILRPVDEPKYYDKNGKWFYLNISDIKNVKMYLNNAKLRLSELGSTKSARVKPNSLILTASATIGKPFINQVKVCVHDGFIPFMNNKIENRFLFYYLKNTNIYTAMGKSNTQKNIYLDEVKNITITYPDNNKQTQIANYLDAKTKTIDQKINLLQQKITHYKAYRKTLINETVSKGLDKSVKLKDSGIDWIGEIPEHWEVRRLKDLIKSFVGGGTPSTGNPEYWCEDTDDGYPWVSISDITKSELIKSTKKYVTDKGITNSSTSLIKKNTILYSIYASLGKVALTKVDCATNQAILAIIENEELINKDFFIYVLKNLEDYVYSLGNTNTQNNISLGILRIIKTVIPSNKSEQKRIAEYLDSKTATIDKIVKNIEAQISTLKELRKTLINEVVTGKVKVVN